MPSSQVRANLIAYNINLNTPDVAIAKRTPRPFGSRAALCEVDGSWALAQPGASVDQPHRFRTDADARGIRGRSREAERYGVTVAGSEIVGRIPRKAIELSAEYYPRYENFRPELVLKIVSPRRAARGGLPGVLDALASPSATPGRKRRRAAAAIAAALGSMVTRLAKLDSDAYEDDRRFFTAAVDRDAEAFNQVMLAYKRPKAERAPFIEEALHGAAEVPLQVTERLHALEQRLNALQIPARFGSDLAVAKALAAAARAGAMENVNINLIDRGRCFRERRSAAAAHWDEDGSGCSNCRRLYRGGSPVRGRDPPCATWASSPMALTRSRRTHRLAAARGDRASRPRTPKSSMPADACSPRLVDAHTQPVFAGNRSGEFERRGGRYLRRDRGIGRRYPPTSARP
jgi:formiminotetrahydrofolate cyclodeaminase